jgi:hypothetical protein
VRDICLQHPGQSFLLAAVRRWWAWLVALSLPTGLIWGWAGLVGAGVDRTPPTPELFNWYSAVLYVETVPPSEMGWNCENRHYVANRKANREKTLVQLLSPSSSCSGVLCRLPAWTCFRPVGGARAAQCGSYISDGQERDLARKYGGESLSHTMLAQPFYTQ